MECEFKKVCVCNADTNTSQKKENDSLSAHAYLEEHLLLLLLMPVPLRQVNDVTDSTSKVNQCISCMTLEHCFIAATKPAWAQQRVS